MATISAGPRLPQAVAAIPTRRILIVDDCLVSRTLMRSMLRADRDIDWQVVEAGSGEEFLEAVSAPTVASQDGFDVIVLDVQMPGMGGLEACRVLREVDNSVPILFVTADASRDGFRKGREAGGDSYLTKPFSRAGLKAALAVLTSLKRR
jgi:CheY-like chemotaxis protein